MAADKCPGCGRHPVECGCEPDETLIFRGTEAWKKDLRADDPDGKLWDFVAFESWAAMIHWAIGSYDAHTAFREASGMVQPRHGADIAAAVDQVSGYHDFYVCEFTRWATTEFWGEDEITPSIRTVLDKMPVRQ